MEANGATVTSIYTADTLDGQGRVSTGQGRTQPVATPSPRVRDSTDLWVGTTGPASLTVFTTGLVIMAEMAFSTLHIPNLRTDGQAHRRLDGAHILLTGPRLHVAGVPGRAAVLPVLTAHGLWSEGTESHSDPKNTALFSQGSGWRLTWGSWQQAQLPFRLGQQVCPTGQLVCWSQPISPVWSRAVRRAGIFSRPATILSPF